MPAYVSTELTHFVGRSQPSEEERFQLLVQILNGGVLLDGRSLIRPSKVPITYLESVDKSGKSERHNYYPEPYFEANPDAPVDTNEFVDADMVCFCDIPYEPVDLFRIHTEKYKRFGLAFRREFAVGQGAAPVFYLPKTAATPLRLVGESGRFADFYQDTAVPSLLTGARSRGAFFNELKNRVLAVTDLFRDRYQRSVPDYVRGQSDPGLYKRRLYEAIEFPVALLPYVFGYIKSFDPSLAEDHPDNFYMEREWRLLGSMRFGLSDVARVLLPPAFADRFRAVMPTFRGEITELPDRVG